MKIAFVVAVIERDMAEKVARIVMPHELPILELVHDKPISVDEKGEHNVAPQEVDPAEEYERLIRQYGEDPKSGLPYVERVFGRLGEFARVLEDLAVDARPARGKKAAAPVIADEE